MNPGFDRKLSVQQEDAEMTWPGQIFGEVRTMVRMKQDKTN